MKKILAVFGTRPEAIKMAPLVQALQVEDAFDVKVCVTAQHRQMLDQVLQLFKLKPDFDLNIMQPEQTLSQLTAKLLLALEEVFISYQPQLVLVHGDTTTSFVASLAAFYAQIPVAHIEAGLRTFNPASPWPEEVNRCLTGVLASLHFAPTEQARTHLLSEGKDAANIFVTGNTVIDALLGLVKQLKIDSSLQQKLEQKFSFIDPSKRLILVTGHRRENLGQGIKNLCSALAQLAQREDVQIIYPVHLNPKVQQPVHQALANLPQVHLIEPLDYLPFVYLMSLSSLIITDSGGIQEEAPALGKPVLVTRSTTERPEAVKAGTVKLVGTDTEQLVSAANEILDTPSIYEAMALAHNPYGDGTAAQQICTQLKRHFNYV